MSDEQALAALMLGHRILLRGGGPIARAAELRLAALKVPVVLDTLEDTNPTDALVIWEPPPSTAKNLGAQIHQLTDLLDTGSVRRVVLVVAGKATVAAHVAQTLTIYAAAHLVQRQTRFNMLRLAASPTAPALERATNTMLMLLCGRMDAVHGQVLTVCELPKTPEVSA